MARSSLRFSLGVAVALLASAAPASAQSVPSAPDVTVPAARDTEAVVLKGSALGGWATAADQPYRAPLLDLTCGQVGTFPPSNPTQNGADSITDMADTSDCPHNSYSEPNVSTGALVPLAGTPIDNLVAFRYSAAKGFQQIPFQVDEVFTRYLNNEASGFSPYSGEDRHTTYAYDREPLPPAQRRPGERAVQGPARLAGGQGPDPGPGHRRRDRLHGLRRRRPRAQRGQAARRHHRHAGDRAGRLDQPGAPIRYVYVMKADRAGVKPAFTAANGYVKYQRDANADDFAYSQSSYGGYGNAPKGYYCDETGNIVRNADGTPKIGQRRPRDTATITTNRYRYRYDGRWLMTEIEISPDGGQATAPTSSTAGRRARSRRIPAPRRRAAATRRRTPTGAARASRSARRSARCARSARPGAPTRAPTSSAARPSTATR